MEKNWNKIGKVFKENQEGKIEAFDNLFEALLGIHPDEIKDVNNRGFISRYYREKYVYNNYTYGGYWSYYGDKYILTDELGIRIPVWKIMEVYKTIKRSVYGWALCNKKYPIWWRYGPYKYREGSVPGIRKWRSGRRNPQKLWQAIKVDYFDKFDEELREYKFKRRNYEDDRFDDFYSWDRERYDYKNRNWKRHRKTQWK